jgi:hypothetical protein
VKAPHASTFLTWAFATFAIALSIFVVWLSHEAGRRLREDSRVTWRRTTRTAAVAAAWLAITWALADTGVLAEFDRRPPPFAIFLVAIFALATGVAFGSFGTRLARALPIWAFVATQAFRLPLEWLLHEAATEGVMPIQMSYSGWNFDFVTGATAVPVAWLLARGIGGRPLAVAWYALGSLLLLNILTIAILSTPMFGAFGPDRLNTWVAYPPFVWLPAVMVVSTLTSHLLIWRMLSGA